MKSLLLWYVLGVNVWRGLFDKGLKYSPLYFKGLDVEYTLYVHMKVQFHLIQIVVILCKKRLFVEYLDLLLRLVFTNQ